MKIGYHCIIQPSIDDGAQGIGEAVFLSWKFSRKIWGF